MPGNDKTSRFPGSFDLLVKTTALLLGASVLALVAVFGLLEPM
ncbi:hypothetical protein ACMDCR_10800 [Labrys okinawensis]